MRIFRYVACAAALMMLAPLSAGANASLGTIYGRVYDRMTGKPICAFPVRLISNKEPNQETRTRSDGSFSFLSVFAGEAVLVSGGIMRRVEVHANLETDQTFYVRAPHHETRCAS